MIDFQQLITDWYRQNKRELPWRNTKNAYHIWLSEIILQQTRVAQGTSYYIKFTEHYPTVFDLANAPENEILNDWQGLGYYSRARNLHFAAKQIVNEFNGVLPCNYNQIRSLKGIGDYTAAAIASFAFDLPHAVVDGNVYRVLSRFFDIDKAIDTNEGKKAFSELANQLIDKKNPALYNQAIMEFGALQCTPTNPNCEECPLTSKCLSFSNNTITLRPVKSKKIKIRNRYFYFLIYSNKNQTIIERREEKDIWQQLYQFPMIETEKEIKLNEIPKLLSLNIQKSLFKISEPITHILSHQKLITRFLHFNSLPEKLSNNQINIKINEIQNFPIPRLIDRYLETTDLQ